VLLCGTSFNLLFGEIFQYHAFQGDFFTGESGERLLPDCGIPQDSFHYPYSSSDDEPSTPTFESEQSFPHASSAETVVMDSATSIHSLSLTKFCGLIEAHQSLQRAEIFSVECYIESIGLLLHRFLVLELRAAGEEPIFLRIDRRRLREYSMWNVRETIASMPTQDSVRRDMSPVIPFNGFSTNAIRLNCLLRKSVWWRAGPLKHRQHPKRCRLWANLRYPSTS